VVAAAVVEVQVGVDDHLDAGEIDVLLAQRPQAGIEVGRRRVRLRDAGCDVCPGAFRRAVFQATPMAGRNRARRH
jgi:hypothetical protein